MKKICILIPTLNEESNISQVLENVLQLNYDVFVYDTNSQDKTREIAGKYPVTIRNGTWATFAEKINCALSDFANDYEWVLRVDADERLDIKTFSNLNEFLLNSPKNISGINIRRKIFFMGKYLRFGGMNPIYHCRITKTGFATYEIRPMDEHILTSGMIISSEMIIEEHESRGFSNWCSKHIRYAKIEQEMYFSDQYNKATWHKLKYPEKIKRFMREEIFNKMPLFIRPVLYFIYRYFLKFGFLDGVAGLVFHVFHALWYRMLVDALIAERLKIEKK